MMKTSDEHPEYNYHLLRHALSMYSKNLQQLQAEEYERVSRSADESFELESLVLGSPEAQAFLVTPGQLEQAMQAIGSRYASDKEFDQDLAANGLDRDHLMTALYRELTFDGVMQLVGSKAAAVSELDVRLFYEIHHERFERPETRQARHILITVNPQFAENTEAAARARIDQILAKLDGRSNRFGKFAGRYSECPTAMEDGRLGEVQRGHLFPQLDTILFTLQENEISPVVESEMGFHILWCEKIKPARRIPLSRAEPGIREILGQRGQRNCQKNWLAELRQSDG